MPDVAAPSGAPRTGDYVIEKRLPIVDYPHVFWPPAAAPFLVLLALSVLADALRSDLRDQSADADVAVSGDITASPTG